MKTLKAERIQRQTVQAQVYEQLREAIMRGEFQPGQSLSIRNVAAALETSTMPVRDAFTRLSVEGAIEISVNRRPTIPIMTVERLEEITRLRTVLEGMATEMAASRISPEALAELVETCQRMQTAADETRIDEYLAENWRFHRRIYAASGSEMLNSVIEMMWLRVGPCIRLCITASGHFATFMACHWKALEALRESNAGAAKSAIVQDITRAAADISRMLRGARPPSEDNPTARNAR